MSTYEQLIIESDEVEVVEKHFKSKAKGLCKGNKIAISKTLKTTAEKACILAEELGHYYTTVGNILDQSTIENRKQEMRARAWAYMRLIPLEHFLDAYNVGITNRYELAEFLDVTEDFLIDVLAYYKGKYGVSKIVGNFEIYFEPLVIIHIFYR